MYSPIIDKDGIDQYGIDHGPVVRLFSGRKCIAKGNLAYICRSYILPQKGYYIQYGGVNFFHNEFALIMEQIRKYAY